MPWLKGTCGNASSAHTPGRAARGAVEGAREQVAELLHCRRAEVVFTSGGTEADNLAIFGTVTKRGSHIITSSVEHHAVLHAIERLEREGCTATYVPVNESGFVKPDDVRRALKPNTRLISVMMANNETGVLQPAEEIGRIARKAGVLFHTDAVQAAGKVEIDVARIGCDLLSISGHKMHGPQGTGALFVRDGVKLSPMFHGGSHESGRRAGTENVAGLVGFGQAAELARRGFQDGSIKKVERLRNELERSLLREAETAGINGSGATRVPNTTNLWFEGSGAENLLYLLDQKGVAVSGGSACTSGNSGSSHVLLAMKLSPARASSSIRFSLSKQTTAEDVDFAIWQVSEALDQFRSGRPTSLVRQNAPQTV